MGRISTKPAKSASAALRKVIDTVLKEFSVNVDNYQKGINKSQNFKLLYSEIDARSKWAKNAEVKRAALKAELLGEIY